MKLNDYQREASGTAIYPGRMSPHGMMYCALKMNGESSELLDHVYDAVTIEKFKPGEVGLRPDRLHLIVKEVGDVAWYLAAMADELQTSLHAIYGGEPILVEDGAGTLALNAMKLDSFVGQIAEQLGKAMRDDGYGMEFDYKPGALRVGEKGNGKFASDSLTDQRRAVIIENMHGAMNSLVLICGELDTSLQLALEINIKKLAARKAKGTLSGSGDNR